MRKAVSIGRLTQTLEVTPKAVATFDFGQLWASLAETVERLWMNAVQTGDDADLHGVTLTPTVGQAATDLALTGAAIPTNPPTTPAPPPVWKVTVGGDATYHSVNVVTVYKVAGLQVVGKQQPAPAVTYVAPGSTYAAPSGGMTIDAEARTSLAQLASDVAAVRAAAAELAADDGAIRAPLHVHGLTL